MDSISDLVDGIKRPIIVAAAFPQHGQCNHLMTSAHLLIRRFKAYSPKDHHCPTTVKYHDHSGRSSNELQSATADQRTKKKALNNIQKEH